MDRPTRVLLSIETQRIIRVKSPVAAKKDLIIYLVLNSIINLFYWQLVNRVMYFYLSYHQTQAITISEPN